MAEIRIFFNARQTHGQPEIEKYPYFRQSTMLAKENRLKKKKDFETVFKKGKGFKDNFLALKIAPNNLKTSRFGFIVSQKVSKKAVVRNKIRRRLSEAIRLNLKDIKRGVDIALIALPGIESKTYLEIKETLATIFKKAGLSDKLM